MNQEELIAFKNVISGCLKEDRTAQNQLYRLFFSYGMSIAMRYVDTKEDAKADDLMLAQMGISFAEFYWTAVSLIVDRF